MRRIVFLTLLLILLQGFFNCSESAVLEKKIINNKSFLISSFFYNPILKNLIYVTPNGKIFKLDPANKKFTSQIQYGEKDEVYDNSAIGTLDEKTGTLYLSFNRNLYFIDGKTGLVRHKANIIENPKKIIVKPGSNKLWLLFPELRTLGIVDDFMKLSSKKGAVNFIDFAKITEHAFYDPKQDGVFLHDSMAKYVYLLGNKDIVTSKMDYRKHIKFLKTKYPSFNSVLNNMKILDIKVPQLKSPYKDEEFFYFDEKLRKIFISLENSLLVFNVDKNKFEKDIENLPFAKMIFTDGEKLFLIFRLGTTTYDGLGVIDLKNNKVLDLTVLDELEKITYSESEKKIYATTAYSYLNPEYLITVDVSSLNKTEFINQLEKTIKEYKKILISNRDKRMMDLYKGLYKQINQLELGLNNKLAWEKGCSPFFGNTIHDMDFELNKFVTPCRSKDDYTQTCVGYKKLKNLTSYLEAVTSLDFNQNNIIDACENLKK